MMRPTNTGTKHTCEQPSGRRRADFQQRLVVALLQKMSAGACGLVGRIGSIRASTPASPVCQTSICVGAARANKRSGARIELREQLVVCAARQASVRRWQQVTAESKVGAGPTAARR